MAKRKFQWWATVTAVINGRKAVDKAVERLQSENPDIDIKTYCRMVYYNKTNTQEGAAALFGIDRRKANDINFRLHCYTAEEMGLFVAKKH